MDIGTVIYAFDVNLLLLSLFVVVVVFWCFFLPVIHPFEGLVVALTKSIAGFALKVKQFIH